MKSKGIGLCDCCRSIRDVLGMRMCFECHKRGCWTESSGKIHRCCEVQKPRRARKP